MSREPHRQPTSPSECSTSRSAAGNRATSEKHDLCSFIDDRLNVLVPTCEICFSLSQELGGPRSSEISSVSALGRRNSAKPCREDSNKQRVVPAHPHRNDCPMKFATSRLVGSVKRQVATGIRGVIRARDLFRTVEFSSLAPKRSPLAPEPSAKNRSTLAAVSSKPVTLRFSRTTSFLF